ncbi:competence protein CoiA family protein [Niallia sp. FSL R7-0271]|uniref:competence protein CoiA family protein n=1 Tax=Niallia sp. FSL R7-0271 TaxID=2921678 RepID=UPI0030FBB051
MGFYALNKNDNKLYSIKEWEMKFINIIPYCPVCGESTEIKAKGSVSMKTHFAHIKGTDCPLTIEHQGEYNLLPPIITDKSNGQEIKKWTKVNTFFLYNKCKELLKGKLKYQEFGDILKKANEKRIWFYNGLNTNNLPYVLLVNYGIFTKKSGIRSEEFYFIFDKVTYGDDLFLQNGVTHIWRVYSNFAIEKIEIESISHKDLAPEYFWNYIKEFIQK